MSERGPGFLSGVLFGGLVGAALGVLFAPRSGDQTRQQLSTWRAENQASEAPESPLEELTSLGAGIVRGALGRLEEAREAARRTTELTEQELLQEWEQRKLGR
jgi:gas vesicle protein